MSFIETPSFPETIALGSSGGPQYSTNIVEVRSGKELRNQAWAFPRHRYNVGFGANTSAKLDELREFHHAMIGRFNGFRFKDFNDWTSAASMNIAISDTDQIIGTGDAAEVDFQLVKIYTVGALSLTRNITKPVTGTVVISLDDVSQGSGWTVDTTTGIVTFSVAPGSSVVVKAGFQFDVPVRFDNDVLQISQISPGFEQATIGLVELLG